MPDGAPRTQMLAVQHRFADIQASSIDVEKRTARLVWSTGAEVRRYDWTRGRDYVEKLAVTSQAVRMGRLQQGAPLLVDHRIYDTESIVGVIEAAWIENGEGWAEVRFVLDDQFAEATWNKVRQGALRSVSISYYTYRYEVDETISPPVYVATDWEPLEISLVAVPADAGAGIRSDSRTGDEARRAACEYVLRAPATPPTEERSAMPEAAETPTAPASPAPAAPVATPPDPAALARAAVEADRTRAADIRARARSVGLPETFADDLVGRGVAVEHAAVAIVDELARRGAPPAQPRIEGTDRPSGDDPAVIRGAMEIAIAARGSRTLRANARIEHTEASRAYDGYSVLEMMATLARAHGEKVNLRQPPAGLYHSLVQMRMLSTSDFPLLLANAGNKIMVQSYAVANVTYRNVFGRKTFRDFKAHSFLRSGDFPALLQKGETAEFQLGAMSEARNPVTLATYGRIISLSRQTLVNDDMGAFADLPSAAGRRVADFENATAWAQLALNSGAGPTIFEKNLPTGRPLFHTADHGNLAASGTTIDVANVGAGRAAMMKQVSLDGIKINVVPRFLVTGPDRFTLAQQFTSEIIQPTQDSLTNPFKGQLAAIGDANLSGNAWYLFADPGDVETLIYGYLDGAEGPQLVVKEGFVTDGVDMRVHLDFAASGVDFRGAYKNPGA